jgi:hypothetical protein
MAEMSIAAAVALPWRFLDHGYHLLRLRPSLSNFDADGTADLHSSWTVCIRIFRPLVFIGTEIQGGIPSTL